VNGQVQIRIRDDIRNAPFPLFEPAGQHRAGPDEIARTCTTSKTAAVFGPPDAPGGVHGERAERGVPRWPRRGHRRRGNLFLPGVLRRGAVLPDGGEPDVEHEDLLLQPGAAEPAAADRPATTATSGAGARGRSGVRYSYLDLSNKFVQAGRLDAVTLGLNWYLKRERQAAVELRPDATSATRPPAANGTVHAFGMRWRVPDF